MRKPALLLALVLALSGCSNSGAIPNEQSFVSGNGVATFIAKDSRTMAPAISGPTLDGKAFADQSGKVRVINVWASWCSPCRAEAPSLQELSQNFPEVQFIGILTRDNLVSARAFVTRFGISYPTLTDDSLIAKFSGSILPNAIPTTLVIDKQGRVAARISGEITYSGLKDVISKVSAGMKDSLINQILSGNVLIAAPIALLAGFVSFASPCVLPLVPGYLTYVSGAVQSRFRMVVGSFLFVLGFTFLFVSYGALFGGLGSQINTHSQAIRTILGTLTVLFGVVFLFPEKFYRSFKMATSTEVGLASAPILGLLFGLGWTPCIGPTLGAVQSLAISESSALRGACLALFYCIGLGVPFLIFALYLDRSDRVRRFLLERSRVLSLLGGSLLILVGLLQITGLWESLMIDLRSSITEFVPVL